MTPDEAVSEYHRVIAEYDRLHAPCPIERRQRHREAERQQRRMRLARPRTKPSPRPSGTLGSWKN
jgi:hypothetical protein